MECVWTCADSLHLWLNILADEVARCNIQLLIPFMVCYIYCVFALGVIATQQQQKREKLFSFLSVCRLVRSLQVQTCFK